MCGADDCPSCHPENCDENGRYIDPNAEGEPIDDYDPPDNGDWDDPRADFIAGNGPNTTIKEQLWDYLTHY
jgi:hypothetical protein